MKAKSIHAGHGFCLFEAKDSQLLLLSLGVVKFDRMLRIFGATVEHVETVQMLEPLQESPLNLILGDEIRHSFLGSSKLVSLHADRLFTYA